MTGLPNHCKPVLALGAKSLKNGAGYRIRTRGPLITNPGASLKYNGFSVNRLPHTPQLSVTFPAAVNRICPAGRGMTAILEEIERLSGDVM